MKTKKKLIIYSVLLSTLIFLYFQWKQGKPFGEPMWSPDGEYYIQRYSVETFFPSFSLPGSGSDSIGGFIRLFTKDGMLLREEFEFSMLVLHDSPEWSSDSVHFKTHPWFRLPRSVTHQENCSNHLVC